MDGKADIAVFTEELGDVPTRFQAKYIFDLPGTLVVSKDHALASYEELKASDLFNYRQLLLISDERLVDSLGFVQLSSRMWRISNSKTLVKVLENGLGWCALPEHIVKASLDSGALVKKVVKDHAKEVCFRFHVIWPEAGGMGPAASWMLKRFETIWS